MNIWELWSNNWANAYAFFNSKGNIKTKARLKKRWCDEYMAMSTESRDVTKDEVLQRVVEILSKHPRSDNYSRDGRLVSVDSIIKEEILSLKIPKVKQ